MSDGGVGDSDDDVDADTDGRSFHYHVDGDLAPAESASVPVTDRGFFYGDVVSETLRAYGDEMFHRDAHTDRLAETCDVLEMDHDLLGDDLRAQIDKTLAANNFGEAYVRLSVTRGSQDDRLTSAEAVDPRVIVIAEPLSRGGRSSGPVWDGPTTIQTVKTRRILDRPLPARAKTYNYLDGILAHVELHVTGAGEALMLDVDGYITEGTTSNLFSVDDNVLCTPSLDGPVFLDVTRRVVLDLARQEGIPIWERHFTPDDVHSANEAFPTNSTWELRPVEAVDSIEAGDDPVTKLLSRPYDDYVERRRYDDDGGSNDADNGDGADSVGGGENWEL